MRTEESIRITLGIIIILGGVVFLAIPFIPLGYVLILIGLFFISPVVPVLRRWLGRLERKDRKGRVRRARRRADKLTQDIKETILEKEEKK